MYAKLFDIDEVRHIIKRNTPHTHVDTEKDTIVLKEIFLLDAKYFVAGTHFNIKSLSAPTKARLDQKVTGRNVFDLAFLTLKNLKKIVQLPRNG